ncbi:Dipeptidyl aminopeptidases/acylaminoacyl-peptidases-like protein [Sandaracinus amylolyticus]|uniref:Dipeptidyl aminopeptidases/acylaminoacyl-peptidases-like protein n=1 Tax=Sandaracinus amylolyticus TaxID=927083 RepID=A0A0F6YMT9_9BACT|nr:Dipeptidyl aminopeptidases/acylaminoacyl-peptidases-like protein [Sandaracinus amylolyticus]
MGCGSLFAIGACALCLTGVWAVNMPFAEQRARHVNHFPLPNFAGPPPEEPPEGTYALVRYAAPLGANWAYVSEPREGPRRPAVVYVHGGFDWSIGALAWSRTWRGDDQSGMAFAQDGLVVMFPSFRGNHDNPGSAECFFGEIDDLVAAADFLAARPDVDPERIYLVGHSTGATLALLTAAASDRYRAVFAIGPTAAVTDYGDGGCLPPHVSFSERWLRDASHFVDEIRTPTFLVEGAEQPSNGDLLPWLDAMAGTAPVEAVVVPGLDHFSVIAPATEVIARAILDGGGPAGAPRISADAIVDASRERCATSVVEGSAASQAEPWASTPHDEWPQLVLTNEMSFSGRPPSGGASAFLIDAGGRAHVATAAHLTAEPGGIEPAVDGLAMRDPTRFDALLEEWTIYPRTQPEREIRATGLTEPAVFDDWLLLRTDADPDTLPSTPLRIAARPADVGDAVFLVGCPYSEETCVQNVYRGRVTAGAEGRFVYDLDPPVDVRGFSGAPVLDVHGHVVGVFSVSGELELNDDGLMIEGEADSRLVEHVAHCAAR